MNEKRNWHAPVFRSLDANATAQVLDAGYVTDDSTADNFTPLSDPGGGGSPDTLDGS